MKKIKPLSLIVSISTVFLLLLISGCTQEGGFKKVDLDLDLDGNQVNDEESAVHDLTPIVTIGDDVAVAVYKCSTDADCYRCKDGDVYTQTCKMPMDAETGTCQGSLDLVKDCKDTCSAGECVDKDEFTAEEVDGMIGEDYDKIKYETGLVDNDDLLPDGTGCPAGIEKCPGYQRGIGSVYLTKFPECKCTYIYVPSGCSPMDPPCPDFSSRSNYPECACTK